MVCVWIVRPCIRKECEALGQPVQIKDDEWAPYARMKSCIDLARSMTAGSALAAVVTPMLIGTNGEESQACRAASRNDPLGQPCIV